jgi:hypothetical protein
MTDEERRIRSYLQAQGAKLSPLEIIDKVQAAMAQLRAAADAVPAGRFDERPAPDEWSATEVMAHVVSAGRRFGDAILAILEDRPRGEIGRSPREEPAPRGTAAEWWAILDRDRGELFQRVRRANPDVRLEAPIDHGMFGSLNWRETLLFLRLHDLDHVGQLERIAGALAGSHA